MTMARSMTPVRITIPEDFSLNGKMYRHARIIESVQMDIVIDLMYAKSAWADSTESLARMLFGRRITKDAATAAGKAMSCMGVQAIRFGCGRVVVASNSDRMLRYVDEIADVFGDCRATEYDETEVLVYA